MKEKIQKLEGVFKQHENLLIAFSGGVDSSLVAYVASKTVPRVLAITALSSTYSEQELQLAKEFTQTHRIEHILIESEELDIPEFAQNPVDRCFHCKNELYTKIKEVARQKGFTTIADGTNKDDLQDYRPGIDASNTHNVVHPLLEAHFTKQDIRDVLRYYGLDLWNKPSAACLASRFPYGETISIKKLHQVEEAEAILKKAGFPVVRVRHFNQVARIEIPLDEFSKFFHKGVFQEVTQKIKKLGFTYIDLDLEGFRSGSMNEGIKEGIKKEWTL